MPFNNDIRGRIFCFYSEQSVYNKYKCKMQNTKMQSCE
jgi:hypothetical protein